MVDWSTTRAAIWRAKQEKLRAIRAIDPIRLEDLLGVERQKTDLIRNTERFLRGEKANHALLWGSRGTGKSSLIKALLNSYADQGLRMLEIDREDLVDLPDIVDEIRDNEYRYIVFCDDLSFETGDSGYKSLKRVLEGSLEMPPENIRVYASSNRRHLLPERMSDNLNSELVGTELHHSDSIEETISLSDRFGLWLSFYPINQETYLELIDHLFSDWSGDRDVLHKEAIKYALARGLRSGRVARQFFNSFS